MGDKEFIGKEKMLSDWDRVQVAILRAGSGECSVKYIRDTDGGVTGHVGELMLQFEEGLRPNFVKNSAQAIKLAKKQSEESLSDDGTISSKQKMIVDWIEVRNSIIRATSGEMKVTCYNNDFAGDLVVGVVVEWRIEFDKPLEDICTDEEKLLVDAAQYPKK